MESTCFIHDVATEVAIVVAAAIATAIPNYSIR